MTFFTQGCPHHCSGCHNPETWDFNGGKEFTNEVLNEIINAINAQGIQRNLCIMGGEPLALENEFLTFLVIKTIKEIYPNIKIYIWTGYTYDELQEKKSNRLQNILNLSDYLIDGRYIQKLKDLTLPMRGSSN